MSILRRIRGISYLGGRVYVEGDEGDDKEQRERRIEGSGVASGRERKWSLAHLQKYPSPSLFLSLVLVNPPPSIHAPMYSSVIFDAVSSFSIHAKNVPNVIS